MSLQANAAVFHILPDRLDPDLVRPEHHPVILDRDGEHLGEQGLHRVGAGSP
jgi:hypothetical protein